MSCPKCDHVKTVVVESRVFEKQHVRKRECLKCGHNFKTVEAPYHGAMYEARKTKPKEPEIKINKVSTDVFNVWR